MKPRNTTRKRIALLACALLISPLLAFNALAATPVSGMILGETWTAAKSPYIVTGDVSVVSLTIEPGVQVQFAGNFAFEVQGIFDAIGTAAAPIVFAPQHPSIGWKGIYFDLSPLSELAHCRVTGSTQGGIRIRGWQPTIRDCEIVGNSASGNPAQGGGISADSDLTLVRCTISNNSLSSPVAASGGGVYTSANLTLESCTLLNNRIVVGAAGSSPVGAGGAVYCQGNLTVRSSFIGGNSITATAPNSRLGWAVGGGIYCGGTLSAHNAAIGYNSITGTQISYGAGVTMLGGEFVNSTVIFNTATGDDPQGGGIFTETAANSPVTILNSILWGNSPSQLNGAFAVTYSDVMGGVTGTGNIDRNPSLFPGGFYVLAGSPAIDAGNPAPAYNDVCFSEGLSKGSSRNDMGAGGGPGACGFAADSAPVIAAQPQSQSACLGQSATFTVSATGTEPLRYQWHLNQTPLSGQTNATLTIASLQASHAGAYTVKISNDAGSVTSNPAHLTLGDGCLDIQMVAGLTVSGLPGATYVISYTTDVAPPQTWLPLATNTLSGNQWFFADRESPASVKRFYRAVRR